MKKLVLTLIFLISVFSFSLEKSGIKEYDTLDFSKGKIIGYYSDKKRIVEEKDAMFYRKEFGKKHRNRMREWGKEKREETNWERE